jgi:hypothetical protein
LILPLSGKDFDVLGFFDYALRLMDNLLAERRQFNPLLAPNSSSSFLTARLNAG